MYSGAYLDPIGPRERLNCDIESFEQRLRSHAELVSHRSIQRVQSTPLLVTEHSIEQRFAAQGVLWGAFQLRLHLCKDDNRNRINRVTRSLLGLLH